MPSKTFIPVQDIKFLYRDQTNGLHIYAIRSPLTHEWIEFPVSEKAIMANIFPETAKQLADYYYDIINTLDKARSIEKLDVTPLNLEEGRIFGDLRYAILRGKK